VLYETWYIILEHGRHVVFPKVYTFDIFCVFPSFMCLFVCLLVVKLSFVCLFLCLIVLFWF
jgi:hypothetical protein